MKNPMVLIVLILISCALILGGALTLPSINFNVTDAAGVISSAHQGRMLGIAEDLHSQTGVQLVLLTVSEAVQPTSYAGELFRSWEIGGITESRGVLLLYAQHSGEVVIYIGEGATSYFSPAQATLLEADILSAAQQMGISGALMDGFAALAVHFYLTFGVEINSDIAELLQPTDGLNMVMIGVSVFLMLMVFGRAISINRKSRKRLKKGTLRKRTSFLTGRIDEDRIPARGQGIHGSPKAEQKVSIYNAEGDVYLDCEEEPEK